LSSPEGYAHNRLQFEDPCRPRTVQMLRHSPAEVALFGDGSPRFDGVPVTYYGLPLETWVYPFSTTHAPNGNAYWDWWQYLQPVADSSMEPYTREPHMDGRNFAFADGHAKFLRPQETGRDQLPEGWGIDGSYHKQPVGERYGLFPDVLEE